MNWQSFILNEINTLSVYFFYRMEIKGVERHKYASVLNKMRRSYNMINKNMKDINYETVSQELFEQYKENSNILKTNNNLTANEFAPLIIVYAINNNCIRELLFRVMRDISIWHGINHKYLCGEYETPYEWGLNNLDYKYAINKTIFNEIIDSYVNVCKNECPVKDYNTTQLAFYIAMHIILSDKDINNAMQQFINEINMKLHTSNILLYNPYFYPQFVNLSDYSMNVHQLNNPLQRQTGDDFEDSAYNSRCQSTYDNEDYHKTFEEYNQDIENES